MRLRAPSLGKVAWFEKDDDEAIAMYTKAIGIYERTVALTGLASE
jgi:hypothetical protein